MFKRDVLDKEMARRFAWRMTEPDGPPQTEATPVESAPTPPDPAEQRAAAEAAAEGRRELAEAVEAAYMEGRPRILRAARKW